MWTGFAHDLKISSRDVYLAVRSTPEMSTSVPLHWFLLSDVIGQLPSSPTGIEVNVNFFCHCPRIRHLPHQVDDGFNSKSTDFLRVVISTLCSSHFTLPFSR
jgi:hypothetical protein